MKNITLDTNAYAALTNGDTLVKEAIEFADKVYVPVIVIAELFYGFKNGSREEFNINLLNEFLHLPGVEVFHTTDTTPRIYAEICLLLRKKGKPIPSNDIWIAALALETESVIVTYDKHFQNIDYLQIWRSL